MRWLCVTRNWVTPWNARELDAAYGRFTALADRKKRIYDQDLISLLFRHRIRAK